MRDQHPARHAVRQAMIQDQLRAAGAILGKQKVDLRFGRRRPRRRFVALLAPLIRNIRYPNAAPIGQLRELGPVRRARLGIRRPREGGA
jgi:hypothetical protein